MRFNIGDKVRLIKTNEIGVIKSLRCQYSGYGCGLSYEYTVDVEVLFNRVAPIHDRTILRINNEVICYDEHEMELVEKCSKEFYFGNELINNKEVEEVIKTNKFKIGDRVKVINSNYADRKAGEVGEIVGYDDSDVPCAVKFETSSEDGRYVNWLREEHIELFNNTPSQQIDSESELTNNNTKLKPTVNTQVPQLPNELDDLDIEIFEYLQSEIDKDNFNYLDKLVG